MSLPNKQALPLKFAQNFAVQWADYGLLWQKTEFWLEIMVMKTLNLTKKWAEYSREEAEYGFVLKFTQFSWTMRSTFVFDSAIT